MHNKNQHNVHIKDAIKAYHSIDRLVMPEFAKAFDLAMVNSVISKINGRGDKKLIKLTELEYDSYLLILKNCSN